MFIVLTVGFLVTETGSAQGCGPHWPLCDGRFTPPFNLHGFVEYGHRAVSGVVGVMVIVLAIWSWRRLRNHVEVVWLGVTGILFTFVQAILGALAVLSPTSPFILATHFGISLIAFAGVLLLDVRIVQETSPRPVGEPEGLGWTWRERRLPPALRWLIFGTTAYMVVLAYLGALVAHTETGLMCRGWPLCRGSIVPPLHGQIWIPYLHRVGALTAFILLLWLYVLARRVRQLRPDVARASVAALALVLVQSVSGWYVASSHLALGAVMIHVTLMTFLFGVMSYLTLQALAPSGGRSSERSAHGVST